MYKARYAAKRHKNVRKRSVIMLISLLLLLTTTIGGTVAYIVTKTNGIENEFNPAEVKCQVEEEFDGTVKSNVNVRNTSNIDAYLRIKLVSYRVNEAGQHIGGVAEIPSFTLGEGWFQCGDHYYYSKPVAPGQTPAVPLIDGNGIELSDYTIEFWDEYGSDGKGKDAYEIKSGDPIGGKQVIEVIAEAIQAKGEDDDKQAPVTIAWPVTIASDGTLTEVSEP